MLKIDFFSITVSDVTVTVGCSARTCWAAVRADAAVEVGGGEAGLQERVGEEGRQQRVVNSIV